MATWLLRTIILMPNLIRRSRDTNTFCADFNTQKNEIKNTAIYSVTEQQRERKWYYGKQQWTRCHRQGGKTCHDLAELTDSWKIFWCSLHTYTTKWKNLINYCKTGSWITEICLSNSHPQRQALKRVDQKGGNNWKSHIRCEECVKQWICEKEQQRQYNLLQLSSVGGWTVREILLYQGGLF